MTKKLLIFLGLLSGAAWAQVGVQPGISGLPQTLPPGTIVDVVKRIAYPWAACNAGSTDAATPIWALGGSNTGTTQCTPDDQAATQDIAQSDVFYVDGTIPGDFASWNNFVASFNTADSTTSHTVILTVALYCTSGTPGNSPSYNSATSVTTTLANGAGAYQVTFSGLTGTGCAAGDYYRIKFTRTNADTATGTIYLFGFGTISYNGTNQ